MLSPCFPVKLKGALATVGPMTAVHMSDLQQSVGNRRGLEFANFLR